VLLDNGGAGITADNKANSSVQKKQPCDATVRITDADSIKPRGVGTKTIMRLVPLDL
jgi:hypothetical protein